ncbi:MAG: HYR domain-containing protein [Deltaproteobacteria bacterium]|nr:HYR domain-containing protein [Deltaproteobacteria bacterium]
MPHSTRVALALGAVLTTAAARAQHPIPGYSAPAIEFVSAPDLVDFTDGFDAPYDERWVASLAGGTIDQSAPSQVVITSEHQLAGAASAGSGLHGRVAFARQSFVATVTVEILDTIGEHCVAVFIDTMRIGLCHFEPEGGGYDVPLLQMVDGQGQLQTGPTEHLQATDGLLTLELAYDAETSTLTGTIAGGITYGPAQLSGAPMSDETHIGLIVTSGRGDGQPLGAEAQGRAAFLGITTDLDAPGSGGYVAALAPFEDAAGDDYLTGLGGVSPAVLFLPHDAGPAQIVADDTPVPADGETDLHVALVTTSGSMDPPNARMTLITTLPRATLEGIPEIDTVDAFIASYFVAQGHGSDYLVRCHPETCDGEDEDCDGEADNGIAATPSTCGVGACAATGEVRCEGGELVDTCVAGTPAADDDTCDGVDDDCADGTDEDFVAPAARACPACHTAAAPTCDDGELVEPACLPVADKTGCDDGDACTTNDRCDAGTCVGWDVVCDSPGECEQGGACTPSTGLCDYTFVEGCVICTGDAVAPALTCPAAHEDVACVDGGASVALGEASASDACSAVTVTDDRPTTFGLGTTEVTFTARDAADNTSSCKTTVEVVDTAAPVIDCPDAITVAGDTSICGAIATVTVDVDDACDGDDVSIVAPVDARFEPGDNAVTVTATDAAGNVATCATKVVVTGLDVFRLDCPAALTRTAEADLCGARGAVEGTLVASCREDATVASEASEFAVGAHEVALAVDEGDGRAATCTTTLTVVDELAPTIACGTPSGLAALGATFTPTASDNCEASVTLEALRCERRTGGEGARVDAGCDATIIDGGVVVAGAPAPEGGSVFVVWDVVATDPSDNTTRLTCEAEIDPASLVDDGDDDTDTSEDTSGCGGGPTPLGLALLALASGLAIGRHRTRRRSW